jgi:hypothetical protein
LHLVLDPRIGFAAFRADCDNDSDLLTHVDETLEKLRQHYKDYYELKPHSRVPFEQPPSAVPVRRSPRKHDFTARYKTTQVSKNELEDYLCLRQEDWDICDPIQWWATRRCQFPNLSQLARDILSIPGTVTSGIFVSVLLLIIAEGSSVAVERIFSGGRDTISLRRASLQPETIRVLMVLKSRLQLTRYSLSND